MDLVVVLTDLSTRTRNDSLYEELRELTSRATRVVDASLPSDRARDQLREFERGSHEGKHRGVA